MADMYTAYAVLSLVSVALLLLAASYMVLPDRLTGFPEKSRATSMMLSAVLTGIARGLTVILGMSVQKGNVDLAAPGIKTLGNIDSILNAFFTTALVAHLPCLAVGLHNSVSSRGKKTLLLWEPATSRAILILPFALALVPVVVILGWTGIQGTIDDFGTWWGVSYRPDFEEWRQVRLGTLVPLVGVSLVTNCWTLVHILASKAEHGKSKLHVWLRLGFMAACAIAGIVYLVCETRLGWHETWQPRVLESTLGWLVFIGTLDHHALRCYLAWLRLRRPTSHRDTYTSDSPWIPSATSPGTGRYFPAALTPTSAYGICPTSPLSPGPASPFSPGLGPPSPTATGIAPVQSTEAMSSFGSGPMLQVNPGPYTPSRAGPLSEFILAPVIQEEVIFPDPFLPSPTSEALLPPSRRIWSPPPAVRLNRASSEFSDLGIVEERPWDSPAPERRFYAYNNDSKHTFGANSTGIEEGSCSGGNSNLPSPRNTIIASSLGQLREDIEMFKGAVDMPSGSKRSSRNYAGRPSHDRDGATRGGVKSLPASQFPSRASSFKSKVSSSSSRTIRSAFGATVGQAKSKMKKLGKSWTPPPMPTAPARAFLAREGPVSDIERTGEMAEGGQHPADRKGKARQMDA